MKICLISYQRLIINYQLNIKGLIFCAILSQLKHTINNYSGEIQYDTFTQPNPQPF